MRCCRVAKWKQGWRWRDYEAASRPKTRCLNGCRAAGACNTWPCRHSRWAMRCRTVPHQPLLTRPPTLASRSSGTVASLSQKELGMPSSSPMPVAAAARLARRARALADRRPSSRPRAHVLRSRPALPRPACSLRTTTSRAHREAPALSATLEQARAPGVPRRLAQVCVLPRGRAIEEAFGVRMPPLHGGRTAVQESGGGVRRVPVV